MKIIDLLQRIANGEEVPEKIRLGNNPDIFYYKKDINSYKSCNGEYLISEWLFNSKRLNEEVEIIEEEKKTKPLTKKDIEALGYACGEIRKCFINGWTKSLETKPLEGQKKIPEKLDLILDEQFTNDELQAYIYETQVKINQVLDYLKSKGE